MTPDLKTAGTQRFYLGGKVYDTWSEVPDSYKVSPGGAKDPSQSTVTYFRFSWK